MSQFCKFLIVIPVLLFILACQAVTRPIEQVKDTAGTAAAFATQAGEVVTQVSGLATNAAPIQTMLPNPSAIPEIPSDIFNPQSPPLTEWKGIPVMPQAIAGDETEAMYVYKIAVTAQEIQDFYTEKLSELGWESSFSMPMAGSTIMVYSKDNQILSITIMPSENGESIVMLTMQ